MFIVNYIIDGQIVSQGFWTPTEAEDLTHTLDKDSIPWSLYSTDAEGLHYIADKPMN